MIARRRNAFRRTLVAGALTIGWLGVSPAAGDAEDAESVFRDARQYTVRIRTQIERPFIEDTKGSFEGSGFLVDAERGWIVTNAHVVGQSPSSVQVAFLDGAFQPARKLYVDTFSDVAVLAIPSGLRTRTAARLDCVTAVRAGEELGVFGHPQGLPFTATRGIVSGHTDKFVAHFIQTDAAVDYGNSGGPAMRLSDGAVVGIATAGIDDDQNAGSNFITPAREVCRILELLRAGRAPDVMAMPFSLLVDEDGRHTLRVGAPHDPRRWPFQAGDVILGIEGEADTLRNLSDLVTALRGRSGTVKVRVTRDGKTALVNAHPVARPSTLARWGISLDGVLIGGSPFEDGATLVEAPGLMVHSIEDGSIGGSLDFQEGDMVVRVDGKSFRDVDGLREHLDNRDAGAPIVLVLRRWSGARRIFAYHVRELPGDEVERIGEGNDKVAAR
jgi:S1-C subfamily serine protease